MITGLPVNEGRDFPADMEKRENTESQSGGRGQKALADMKKLRECSGKKVPADLKEKRMYLRLTGIKEKSSGVQENAGREDFAWTENISCWSG